MFIDIGENEFVNLDLATEVKIIDTQDKMGVKLFWGERYIQLEVDRACQTARAVELLGIIMKILDYYRSKCL